MSRVSTYSSLVMTVLLGIACAGAYAGPRQAGRPAVTGNVPGVQLTAEQRQRVMEIRRQTQQRVQEVRQDTTLTAQQRQERIAEIRRTGHEQVMEVLTPEQRRQFQQWWQERGSR